MKFFKKNSIIFSVLIGLFLSLPLQSFAKEPNNEEHAVRYVALGDSLAAGQTPYHTIGLGYANYIANDFQKEHVHVKLTNEGVPGYTSEQLKESILLNTQEQAFIRSANLITIDIGANDLLGVIQTNVSNAPSAIQSVGENLAVILGTIHHLNPRAHVYVMGYYNPFPYLPNEQQASLIPLLHQFNQVIQTASLINHDTYVPTEQTIAKNPFVYIPNPQDIHLSPAGYQAVAADFWRAIDRDDRDRR